VLTIRLAKSSSLICLCGSERVRMTSDAGDKYLTTRALEWFDGARQRFWKWLFDEERYFNRPTAIASFLLGAFIARIEPDVLFYVAVAVGAVIALTFVVGFLLPVVYLVEWGLRKATGR
jgi:hypothetical protein